MKSLYLYTSQSVKDICVKNDIFCFKNNIVIAIDKSKYSKEARRNLQKQYEMYPYPISQRVLKEILLYMLDITCEFRIINVSFIDDSIENEPEYSNLQQQVLSNNIKEVYKLIFCIMDEFNTDMHKLFFRYKGYDLSLSTEGVLTIEAPDEILFSFITANKPNKLILGLT